MHRTTQETQRLAALLCVIPALTLGAASAVAPKSSSVLRSVESQEGRFRVELPDALPDPARRSRLTVLGTVDELHYVLRWEGARISLELYEIPRIATFLFPSSLLLDQAAGGVVEDMKARELERKPMRRGRLPSQLVTYELPGHPTAIERALIVLDESRLYVIVVTAPPGQALAPGLERVIDSFEITSP